MPRMRWPWPTPRGGRSQDISAGPATLWQRAAERGHATAQYNLGSLLIGKAATSADIAGAAWLGLAAEQGDVDAQFFLGNLYYNGEGVPRQPLEALRLWRQAAEQGSTEAQFSLAQAYLQGTAVP